jgi:hypothetical protein
VGLTKNDPSVEFAEPIAEVLFSGVEDLAGVCVMDLVEPGVIINITGVAKVNDKLGFLVNIKAAHLKNISSNIDNLLSHCIHKSLCTIIYVYIEIFHR